MLNQLQMGIKSTSSCIETTLYRINWTPFEMADEQLGYNCWFLFQQCVYMASNAKEKYKNCLTVKLSEAIPEDCIKELII